MKLKWLWVILLVMSIVMVCGLIVAVLGITFYSYTSGPSLSSSIESVIEQVVNPGNFGYQNVSSVAIEEKTFPVGNEKITLVIENDFGNIVATGKETDQISMSVTKTAWGTTAEDASNNLELLQYEVLEEAGKLTIRAIQPSRFVNRSGSMDFKLDVPVNIDVVFHSDNGVLDVSNLKGAVNLENGFGDITGSDLQEGELIVKSQNGNIILKRINIQNDPLTVKSSFGDVKIDQANAAHLEVTLNNGSLNLDNINVSDRIILSNDYGNIDYRNGQADTLTIKSLNGTISINGIKVNGLLKAHSDFGDIDFVGAKASDYDLLTKNGKITLDGADQAHIKAETDFGEIEMKNLTLAVLDLKTKNGPIQVYGSLAMADHYVYSDFGNITLTLPQNQSIGCDLKTDFGSIQTAFEMSLSGSINEKHLVGKINNGGGLLTVETANGDIILKKTTVAEEK